MRRTMIALFALAAIASAAPRTALAWGAQGHRMIGETAIETLPEELPAFVRSRTAALDVGEYSREPDRWKSAGRTHDDERDPAHFLNLADDGTVAPGVALAALPLLRAEYDTALRAAGRNSWNSGFLPYAVIDGWQQLAKDFALWRATKAAGARGPNRAWYRADLRRREALLLADIGRLSHYVGDGSQPLHVTVHYNGWGPFPNPEDFTQDKIHGPFEGAFVTAKVTPAAVRAAIGPFTDCACPIEQRTAAYLAKTNAETTPFYRLWKAGAFQGEAAQGTAFATARLAAGATELRDLIVLAWRASATGQVGWPQLPVDKVTSGEIDPYRNLYGSD